MKIYMNIAQKNYKNGGILNFVYVFAYFEKNFLQQYPANGS